MVDSGLWIGPLIAVVLALRLRPAYLGILGLTAFAGFLVSFNVAASRYPDCQQCPRGEHILRWFNGLFISLAAALFLLALAKYVFRQLNRPGSDLSAKPS